jgi:hypothetical protein
MGDQTPNVGAGVGAGSNPLPTIQAVAWLPARDVLGGEASHFTPWLAENLDILAEAIGLSELNLIETEVGVIEKRLDILATGVDEDGNERPVVIENQYGISNHRHLGQVVTYLAQQERGLAVWVVEDYSEAHHAAVEFLNRTSTPEVGYFLTRVRFTSGVNNVYQVHFEVLSRPNEFVRRGRRRSLPDEARPVNVPKKQYLAEMLSRVQSPLHEAGYRGIAMHARGAYIHMRFPERLEIATWSGVTIRATRSQTSVRLHLQGFESREENSAALDVLREKYAKALQTELPKPASIDWHGGLSGAESDFAGIDLDGAGYGDGDVERAASWALDVCKAWLAVVDADPLSDLRALVETSVVEENEKPTELGDG